mmetsp:Transcript_12460/g.25320  ORF Transcript_12460/g.25320 Transcript_12460/m.25320 type:complete len:210 (-) Transcript_12460:61-690(-)
MGQHPLSVHRAAAERVVRPVLAVQRLRAGGARGACPPGPSSLLAPLLSTRRLRAGGIRTGLRRLPQRPRRGAGHVGLLRRRAAPQVPCRLRRRHAGPRDQDGEPASRLVHCARGRQRAARGVQKSGREVRANMVQNDVHHAQPDGADAQKPDDAGAPLRDGMAVKTVSVHANGSRLRSPRRDVARRILGQARDCSRLHASQMTFSFLPD